MTRLIGLLLLATALTGSQALGQTASPKPEHRLDLFIRALRPPSGGAASSGATIPQAKFEQVLRIFPPVSTGHGGGAPLVQSSQGANTANQDTSVYGFCYQACATERAIGSCGTPAPGKAHAPMQLCKPIEFNPTLSAIIGPRLGTGASPFVDDNKSTDPAQQPAGYTFFGQFIDHDVTRTQTALSALNELNQRAQGDAAVRGKLAAAGITPDQLKQAIANAATPTSALSLNTGKLVKTFLYSCKPGLGDDAEIRIPHEFAVAAFRLGHTLVRDSYVLHDPVLDANGTLLTGQSRPIFALPFASGPGGSAAIGRLNSLSEIKVSTARPG